VIAISGPAVFLEFAAHTGLAVVGFFIVCAAASGLHLSTGFISSRKLLPWFFVWCIEIVAWGLFLLDLTGFVLYGSVEGWNLLGDILALIHWTPAHAILDITSPPLSS
jgi:hypothetical protein